MDFSKGSVFCSLTLVLSEGHGQLDMFSEQEINKKLMLERFQARDWKLYDAKKS